MNIAYASFIYRSRWAMGVVAGIAMFVLVQATFSQGHADLGWQWSWMHVGLAKVLTSFTIGACVRRYLPACPWALRGWSVAALFLVLDGVFALPVPEGPWRAILDLAFILLISPTLIWFGASIAATPGQEAWFKTLGGASYGMYVIHLPLMFAAGFVGHKLSVQPLLLGLSFVVAVQALAIWLERRYDRPLRAWLSAAISARLGAPVQLVQEVSTSKLLVSITASAAARQPELAVQRPGKSPEKAAKPR